MFFPTIFITYLLDIKMTEKYESGSIVTETFSQLLFDSPPICEFRQALDTDIPQLEYLSTQKLHAVFGYKSIEQHVKRCFFSMLGINIEGKPVCLVCLDDHPNIPALPASEWENWIKSLYNIDKVTSQNTLWIHLMACSPQYTHNFTKPLLEQVYLKFPLVSHLIVVVPGETPKYCYLEEHFTCVVPVGYRNPKTVQSLHITWRNYYTKKYKIRRAVEEDNDDIVPLIDSHSTRLKELYGEFYISELLTKHPGMNRNLIVAEIKERAVAVLILNGEVNYETLFNNFYMEPFNNIYKIDAFDHKLLESTSLSFMSEVYVDEYSNPKIFRQSLEQRSDSDLRESLTDILLFDNGIIDYDEIFPKESNTTLLPKLYTLNNATECTEMYKRKISIQLPQFMKWHQDSAQDSNQEDADSNQQLNFNPVVFTLEVMASGDEHETAVVSDLLEASFQSFTDKQYCVFSILHNMPHFPLIDHFVKVVPRSKSTFPQELYILHKNAIKAKLEVHHMHKSEYKHIKKLISHIDHSNTLLDSVTKSLYGAKTNTSVYIMKNYNAIVGVLVVREELDIEYYLMHFEVHKILDFIYHKYDRFGFIEHCILSPIFQKHMPFFLRETHRLTGMSLIFYKLETTEQAQHTRTKPLPAILKDLVPVLDRRLPVFNNINLEDIVVAKWFLQPKVELFSLHISTPRICSLPRIDINSRLVVVGDSITGLSFLKSLIFEYNGDKIVNFNNLTLVFNRSYNETAIISKYTAGMFVFRGHFTANHLYSIAFHTSVNFINGTMTGINRKHKYITVNSDSMLPYDYLFLMCGLQYDHPYGEGVRADKEHQPCPKNVFVINKYNSADTAIRTLVLHVTNSKKRTIIVYGATLHAYTCIATLQAMDLKNYCIKFVEPYQDEVDRPSIDVFNNPILHETMHHIIEMCDIEVYRGYYFSEWQLYPRDSFITAAKFQSRYGYITLPCDFMFSYANKSVAFNTFTAINSAGIVYDGGVVIQPDCRTNDPCIFAAGPMTKYSRRFYADKFVHKYYDSHEIGERLGRQIRAMLLPGGLKENKGDPIFDILHSKYTSKLVPQYTEPIIVSCILPGKINYFNIRSPGKQLPLEKYLKSAKRGLVFTTGNLINIELDSDPKFFRIQYDYNNFVDQITCFTRQKINVTNYIRLWGKHEKMLNNLQKKYDMGLITDFYEFFNSSYFCAIYTDTFINVQNEFQLILTLLTDLPGCSLYEDIIYNFVESEWKTLNEKQIKRIKDKVKSSKYHTMIVDKVMEYLGTNYRSLPMYAHPLVTKLILGNTSASPLFH